MTHRAVTAVLEEPAGAPGRDRVQRPAHRLYERLAELAGVSNTSVWKIEQGGGANPATLKKLADVLGVKPVDLLRERR